MDSLIAATKLAQDKIASGQLSCKLLNGLDRVQKKAMLRKVKEVKQAQEIQLAEKQAHKAVAPQSLYTGLYSVNKPKVGSV